MNAPPIQGPGAPVAGWARRNRWWLAGAVVMGVLAFVLPYRSAQHEWGRRGYNHPVEARAQGWTNYQGSRWRLVEVLRDDAVGKVAGGYVHADASLLLLVYEVIPGKGVDAGTLDRCRGRLSDARGRVWGGPPWGVDVAFPGDGSIAWKTKSRVARALGLETGCGSRAGVDVLPVKARPTRPFRFFHMFLVPRQLAAQGLYGEIVVDPYRTTPPGSYVRFKLGASRPLQQGATSRN